MKFHYKVFCIIIGSLIAYFLISYDTENEDFLSPANAPKIKSIFENNKKDPHLKFKKEQEYEKFIYLLV